MAKTKKPKAFWRQFGFQLNQNDIADNRRIELIDWLKKGRMYNTVLRDGLDIVFALRYNDDASHLMKHFPNVIKTITGDADGLTLQLIYNRQEEILNRINELEAHGVPTQSITTGKTLSIGHIAAPILDDDGDTVVINRDLTSNPTDNFLASFSNLGGSNGNTKKD